MDARGRHGLRGLNAFSCRTWLLFSFEGNIMAKGMNRRTVLKSMVAGGAAALGLGRLPLANAASGRVVIGTWGGDYAHLLTKNIETPLLKPLGINVVQDQASDAPRRS